MDLTIGPRGVNIPQLAGELATLSLSIDGVYIASKRVIAGRVVSVTPYLVVSASGLMASDETAIARVVAAHRPAGA